MNNIYKLKFSRKTLELVAVAEIATNTVAGSFTTPSAAQATIESISPSSVLSSTLVKLGVLAGSALTLALGSATSALANNGLVDPNIVAGSASIVTNGSVTTITNSPNTIINWQQFNIGKNELVQFIQESSNSAVLNRVLGNSVSEILGTLKSNGKVFLINPNGILFGANAVVDTNSLVASTLNMSDSDFQAGKYVFNQEKDRAIASVLNQGVIKVQNDGTLALVGGNVVNTGILEAKNGSVYLLAGQSIQIADMNNPLISFKITAGNKAVNLGEIVAKNVTMLAHGVNHGKDPVGSAFTELYTSGSANSSRISATGEVELYAGSVSDQLQTNQQTNTQVTGERSGLVVVNGEISTTNATGTAGRVKVLGDTVYLEKNSRINANGEHGGYVNIGGDYQGQGSLKLSQSTVLSAKQEINVSAQGNAGTAIVWGNTVSVDGTIAATSQYGKGGFVETSGNTLEVKDTIFVNTKSSTNVTGEWLLDPSILEIVACGTSVSGDIITGNGPNFGNEGGGPGSVSRIYNDTIEKALNNTNVTLIARDTIQGSKFTLNPTNKTTSLTLRAIYITLDQIDVNVGSMGLSTAWFNDGRTHITNSNIVIQNCFTITDGYGGYPKHNVNIGNTTIIAPIIRIDSYANNYRERGDITITNSKFYSSNYVYLRGNNVNINNLKLNEGTDSNGTPYQRGTLTLLSKPNDRNVSVINSNIFVDKVELAGGRINLNGGTFNVRGDVIAQQKDSDGVGSVSIIDANTSIGGQFYANNAGNVIIEGNKNLATVTGDVNITTNGYIRIAGNVSFKGKTDLTATNGQYVVFANGNANVTNLNITSEQNITFNNYSLLSTGELNFTQNGSNSGDSVNINTSTIKVKDNSNNLSITTNNTRFYIVNSNVAAKDILMTSEYGTTATINNASLTTPGNVTLTVQGGNTNTYSVNNANFEAKNVALISKNGSNYSLINSKIKTTESINITSGVNGTWIEHQRFNFTNSNLTAGTTIDLKGNKGGPNNYENTNLTAQNINITGGFNIQLNNSTVCASDQFNYNLTEANDNSLINRSIITASKVNISSTSGTGTINISQSNISSTVGELKIKSNNLSLTNTNLSANTSLTFEVVNVSSADSRFHAKYGALTVGDSNTLSVSLNTSCFTTGLLTGESGVSGADSAQDLNITGAEVYLNQTALKSSKNLGINATTGNATLEQTSLQAVGNIGITANQNISVANYR